ncbi:MAG: nicotinate-nucleotide--dimethylbenzimidazole phosphoribosyltransferase [Dysosmobacter welbionis]
MGFLETVVENVAALAGSAAVDFSHRALLVLCRQRGGGPGVTITSSVTAAVAENLAAGRSSVCMMAKVARCRVVPVDMGILDFSSPRPAGPPDRQRNRISPWDPP